MSTTCTAVGPCTPSVSSCSMSPVRLGPVMSTRFDGSRSGWPVRPRSTSAGVATIARRGERRKGGRSAGGSRRARRRAARRRRPIRSRRWRATALVTPSAARAAGRAVVRLHIEAERARGRRRRGRPRARRTRPRSAWRASPRSWRGRRRAPSPHSCGGRRPRPARRARRERRRQIAGIEVAVGDRRDRRWRGQRRMDVVRRDGLFEPAARAGEERGAVAVLGHAQPTSPSRQRSRNVRAAGRGAARPRAHACEARHPCRDRRRDATERQGARRGRVAARVGPRRGPRPPGRALDAPGWRRSPGVAAGRADGPAAGSAPGHASMHAPQSVDASGELRRLGLRREQRREDRAHRARIHPAVGVPAGLPVHGADVEARAAADAGEHLVVLGAEQRRSAVVEDHDVQLVGTVDLAGAARARDDRRVRREPLAGRGPGEQGEQEVELVPRARRDAPCPGPRRGPAATR